MSRLFFASVLTSLAIIPKIAQEPKTNETLPKESVKLTLLSVKRLDLKDEKNTWLTFRFKIDNRAGQNITVHSGVSSAFGGLSMIYLDEKGNIVSTERWMARYSLESLYGYVVKPGVNEGSINCYLPNEMFAHVGGFEMAGTLPCSEYHHHLKSNLVRLSK